MSSNSLVKILFRFYSNILDEETTETMWAGVVDSKKGLYKLDNIPFYAPLIASADIVFAEYDHNEEMLAYRNTIEYSGNSTVHVILTDDQLEINSIRKIFEQMKCPSERYNDKYFALEIPFDVDYKIIKLKLNELERDGIIDYAETSLSEKHQ